MTDTTPAVDLEIPRAAFDALHDAADAPMTRYVQAIAAPVVAAELRRLIKEEFSGNGSGHVRAALRARAEELDGGKP